MKLYFMQLLINLIIKREIFSTNRLYKFQSSSNKCNYIKFNNIVKVCKVFSIFK